MLDVVAIVTEAFSGPEFLVADGLEGSLRWKFAEIPAISTVYFLCPPSLIPTLVMPVVSAVESL